MSIFDLISLIFENLARRKARVALTAIGVIIGTASIVVLVSLVIGLQRNATANLMNSIELTSINVYPGYSFPEGMQGGGGLPVGEPTTTLITDDAVETIAAFPNVEAVITRDYTYPQVVLRLKRLESWAGIAGIGGIQDLSALGVAAQAGTTELARGTIVVGYNIKTWFMDPRPRPGQEPPSPPDLMGQTLQVTLIKQDEQGQEIRKKVSLKVTGVLAETRTEPDYSIYAPIEDVIAWNEWYMGKRLNRDQVGYSNLLVKANDPKNTIPITDQIKALGYEAHTLQTVVEGNNSFFLVMQVIFGGIGAISLLVAAIGIANTMAMAILERTREIGLMKAVGATNRDVLSIFLGESAGIGFLGGLGGILVGWSAGQIIQVLGLVYLAGQTNQGMGPPTTIAIYTPSWLLVFALIFATLIGLLSGIYPALRAANIVPVYALKYE